MMWFPSISEEDYVDQVIESYYIFKRQSAINQKYLIELSLKISCVYHE